MNINTINVYGNVYITNQGSMDNERVSQAKDKLVTLLYNKRDWKQWGGRNAWEEMLHLYMTQQYEELRQYMMKFPNSAAKDKALDYLNTITPIKPKNKKKKKHHR